MKTGIFKVGKSDWSKNTVDGIYQLLTRTPINFYTMIPLIII